MKPAATITTSSPAEYFEFYLDYFESTHPPYLYMQHGGLVNKALEASGTAHWIENIATSSFVLHSFVTLDADWMFLHYYD